MDKQELREKIAEELFDIWKEAKDSGEAGESSDNWGCVSFRELPNKHRHEYYLTTDRILRFIKEAGYVKLPEDSFARAARMDKPNRA